MSSAYRLELAAGQVLFREGDAPTAAFLIERGEIEVSTLRNGAVVILSRLGPGSLLGEMAVLDASPRTATATAMSACTLTPIDRTQFAERLVNADPVVRALLLSQLSRYRSALATFAGEVMPIVTSEEGGEPDIAGAGALDKIRLESQLREALEQHELEVRLQPIVDIADGRLAGYEALTRWTHPERGPVSPMEFIALAEETSLIVPVGEYVLHEVCKALKRLSDSCGAHVPFIALNVSGRELDDPNFVARVLALMHAHGVSPRHLKLEITESLVLDYVQVSTLIAHSHAVGIRVVLDDFGTGYSNLGHLHKLEFDTLKLDQGFIRQLDDPRCLAIVRAIIDMARALNCDIVAEGVETREQLDQLWALRCDYAQGYLIGKPQSIAEALATAADSL